ncbi:MAG TPA: aminotransferase class V-fold PLP-dependent enzyme [Balneolales bacterium]|nr:aminotransferase class V-fold PLP-dependent enzyme [Balneolales bacterium]
MSDSEKLTTLESKARMLEPDSVKRSDYIQKVVEYGRHFLDDLDHKKAYQQSNDNGSELFDYPIKEEPDSVERLLKIFDENVTQTGLNPASGRHFGYIPGGGVFPSALGDFLTDVTNPYAGIFFASPGGVRMENMLIRWMCDMVGYPKETSGGNLTSGGSIANLTAIVAARDHFGLKGKDYGKSVIYATEHVHHCIDKAVNIAGMRESVIRHVPMDSRFRMKTDELERMIIQDQKAGLKSFMVIASCGTTDVGAVDPISEIGDIAEKHHLWFHIDGAYGGFFLLSEEGRKVIKDLHKADSVIVDPHKGLFLPYGTGAVLVKDKADLFHSFHYTANYMQDSFDANEELSPADLSPELSKHFRGLRMWLPLKLFGLAPFRAALDEKILLTRYFYEKISELDGFETGPHPDLSILFFRYVPKNGDPDTFNERLTQEIQKDGRVFFSSTKINGAFYIRLAVVSFRTHRKDIDLALQILEETVRKLEME